MSQQINLFSPIFLHQKKHFSAVPMMQGIGVVLLAMLGFYAYATHQVSVLAAQSSELAKRAQAMQAKLEKSGAGLLANKKTSTVQDEIKLAEAELKQHKDLISSLGGGPVGNTDGYSVFMQSLARQNLQGLWLTGFSVADSGNELHLSGRALNAELIPVFIRKLNQEPFLRGRSFEYLQIRAGQADVVTPERPVEPAAPAAPAPGSALSILSRLLTEQPIGDKQGNRSLEEKIKPREEPVRTTTSAPAPAAAPRSFVEFDLSTRAPDAGGKAR